MLLLGDPRFPHIQFLISRRKIHNFCLAVARDPEHIENLKQAHVIFLDVVGHGGLHQYDVPLEGPGTEHVHSYTAPVDEHCPQEKSFGLLRCTGHQHVGTCSGSYGLAMLRDNKSVPSSFASCFISEDRTGLHLLSARVI